VIVVESPDTNLFEQAIFIVRNDALSKDGVTAQQLVDEAVPRRQELYALAQHAPDRCCGAARPCSGARRARSALRWSGF